MAYIDKLVFRTRLLHACMYSYVEVHRPPVFIWSVLLRGCMCCILHAIVDFSFSEDLQFTVLGGR